MEETITQLAQKYVEAHWEETPYRHGEQNQTAITEKTPSQEADEIAKKILDIIRSSDDPSSLILEFAEEIREVLQKKLGASHPSEFVPQSSMFVAEMIATTEENPQLTIKEYEDQLKVLTDRMYMQPRQEGKEEIFFQEAMPLTLKGFDEGLDLEILLEKARRIFFIRMGSALPTVELTKHIALALAERIKNN
jgi:hypothetical protein